MEIPANVVTENIKLAQKNEGKVTHIVHNGKIVGTVKFIPAAKQKPAKAAKIEKGTKPYFMAKAAKKIRKLVEKFQKDYKLTESEIAMLINQGVSKLVA